ncbi:MAG: sugar isomerase, partial [Clostridia bacterium]|nr:sugar isomerase [Clostridia bacterium]
HRKDEPCYSKNMREWFQVKPGHFTVARIDQDHGKYSIVAGECDSTTGPYTNGTYLWAKFKNLPAWERKLVEGPYIHHVSEIEGGFTNEIREACKYIPALNFDGVEE